MGNDRVRYVQNRGGVTIGVETDGFEQFDEVVKTFTKQAQGGVQSMAEAVQEDVRQSMKFGGEVQNRTKGGVEDGEGFTEEDWESKRKGGYRSAPDGAPPYFHSGAFRDAIQIADVDGVSVVGVDSMAQSGDGKTPIGMRGAWFEFGGRAQNEHESESKGRKRKRRKGRRRWKQHPFLGPALRRMASGFVHRVVGSWT